MTPAPVQKENPVKGRMKQNKGMAKSVPSKRGLSPNSPRKPRVSPSGMKAWEKPTPTANEARQRPATRTSSNGSIPAKRRVGPRDENKIKMPAIVTPSSAARKDMHGKKELTPTKQLAKFPKPSDVYANGSVSDSHVDYHEQLREAKLRERGLVDEIQVLKTELLKQSSQLQENFHIVISLQEQVARLQEEQLKQQAKEKRQNITNQKPDINQSLRRSSMKSAVCSIM